MNKKDLLEIKGILSDLAKSLRAVEQNQTVLKETVDAWDSDFKEMRRAVTNVELVCGETAKQVQQIHGGMIETANKLGGRVRTLELVKKDPPSGGRRPAKKN